jgi:uridine kinase
MFIRPFWINGEKKLTWQLCAIDGPGGSGKSSLAQKIAAHFPQVKTVSMDSFYLPEKNYRLAVIAKNYDLERLEHEVLIPAKLGDPIAYQKHDWEKGELSPTKTLIPAGVPIVVEGIYCLEMKLREYYDFSFFVDADKETLLRRAVSPVSSEVPTWVEKWLPAEDVYLQTQAPEEFATLRLDGAVDFPSISELFQKLDRRVS